MAKRRLNKNLVGLVTAAGVFLAVLVVAVAAYNASRRDPDTIARKALSQEEIGEWRRAIELYQKAFSEKKEAKYLLSAARVAREHGELGLMFSLLELAYAQSPDDNEVLSTLLQRYWEIRDVPMGASHWQDVLARADRFLNLDPGNTLALSMKLQAAERLSMREEERELYAPVADETLDLIHNSGAIDPYLAMTLAFRSGLRAVDLAQNERIQERYDAAEQALTQGLQQAVDVLLPAVQAYPDNGELRVTCAKSLAQAERWDEAGRILEEGLTLQAGVDAKNDPDLHYELADVLYQKNQQKADQAEQAFLSQAGANDASQREELEKIRFAAVNLDEARRGLEHAAQAVALEPAIYDAYRLYADLQQLIWRAGGEWSEKPLESQRAVLEYYSKALNDTVGLESLRAVTANFRLERLTLISRAFDAGMSFYRFASEEDAREQAMTYMRSFLHAAQTQFPERARTRLMEGYVSQFDGELRAAVKAFDEAQKQAEKAGGFSQNFAWLARENLSRLYAVLGEPGLALQYTEQVIEYQASTLGIHSKQLELQRLNLLLSLNQNQQALDHADRLAQIFPDWDAVKAVRARALTALDRGEQALREIGELASDNPRYLMEQARIADANSEYVEAENLYRQVLETETNNAQIIERIIRVLVADGREDEALQFIRERLDLADSDALRRLLKSHEILLVEKDPEKQKQLQLDLIASIPDEYERLISLYNFWRSRGELEHAQHYLDQMEQTRPDDLDVKRLQFDMALKGKDCQRAERYLIGLVNADADQVGGTMFRGRYEMVCGDPSRALTEFRSAEREFPRDSTLKRYIAHALTTVTPPRYEEAVDVLKDAIEYDPGDLDARKLIYACYEMLGRRDEGIPHLDQAVTIAANNGIQDPFINERAQLVEEEREPRKGIEAREKIRAEQPQNSSNLLRLAELYDKVGDVDEARERLSEAAQINPEDFSIARFGARFYSKHNDPEGGEELLQRHLQSQSGIDEIVARILIAQFQESLSNAALRMRRQLLNDRNEQGAADSLASAETRRQAALEAFLNARERSEALPGDDHDRAVKVSLTELARFYQRTGRWEDMIETYRTLLARLGGDDLDAVQNARLNVIAGLRTLKRYGDARQEVEAYRREFPEDRNGIMAEVELLMSGVNLTDQEAVAARTKARELLTRVLSEDPENAWAWYMRGLIGAQQQRYTDARDDLLEAQRLSPMGFDLKHRMDLARVYELMDQPKLAEAELRQLTKIEYPNVQNARLALISLLQRTEQIDLAMEFVNQMKAEDPRQPFWPYQLGLLLGEKDEFAAAAREVQKAVELTEYKNPRTIETWLDFLNKANRANEAVRVFENLPLGVSAPGVKSNAAAAYWTLNRRDVAIALFQQAINDAGQVGVRGQRIMLRAAENVMGRDEALTLVRGLLDAIADPDDAQSLKIVLAEFLAADQDAARRNEGLVLAELLLKNIDAESALYYELITAYAVNLDRADRPAEAAETYERAVELRPNDLRALNNLAYLLADRLGRPEEALPYARRMEEADPENAILLDTVGWVYFKAGLVDRALMTLKEAARLDPSNAAVRYHTGMILAEAGRTDEARVEFNRVLDDARENSTNEYVEKAEKALADLR